MSKQKQLAIEMAHFVKQYGQYACQQALTMATRDQVESQKVVAATNTMIPPFANLVAHFNMAAVSVKYPHVYLYNELVGQLKLQRNLNGKDPGSISITDADREWVGTIRSNGAIYINARDAMHHAGIREAVVDFQANPEANASAYGHSMCQCCFCGKELSTKISTTVGYGPTCAMHWGLPHEMPEEKQTA